MSKQIIKSPSGERMVVIPEAEYEALMLALEDASDAASVRETERRIAAGEEELVPAEVVDRIIGGENLIRVWREYRGLSAKELASKADIAQAYLSQLETGKRDGPAATLKKIAAALDLSLDDLVR